MAGHFGGGVCWFGLGFGFVSSVNPWISVRSLYCRASP